MAKKIIKVNPCPYCGGQAELMAKTVKFCNDTIITDGSIRDKLQATLMGIIGGIDEVCFNRDRLFFGGKGYTVLYPDYDTRINAESIIEN